MPIMKIKDLITKEIFQEENCFRLAKKLSLDPASVQRLLNRNIKGKQYNHLKDRYVNLFDSKTFIFVDYDTGEEFECCNNGTLFLHFNTPYSENLCKYITAVKSGKQSILSFAGKILFLKGNRPEKVRPQKAMTPAYLSQLKEEKIQRKIATALRRRINDVKRIKSFKKSAKTESLLGCSFAVFKEYIESKFAPEMSWDNHGSEIKNKEKSWHIDHIIPCNTFDLSNPEEQKKCFHYSNMRPLWESENLKRPRNGNDI